MTIPEVPHNRVQSRAFYSATISAFLAARDAEVIDALVRGSSFSIATEQRDAWLEQIRHLRATLPRFDARGWLALEYAVPRVGRRIDTLVVLHHVLFVIEYKVGESRFTAEATEQVWDYALDLKNFHSTSHDKHICPILVATAAGLPPISVPLSMRVLVQG